MDMGLRVWFGGIVMVSLGNGPDPAKPAVGHAAHVSRDLPQIALRIPVSQDIWVGGDLSRSSMFA